MIPLALALALAGAGAPEAPTPAITRVMVHAVAHDAKVLGDHVGGARITVRDVETGRVLAEGIQKGGTGDTDRIMRQPRQRFATVYDTPGTAGFLAEIPLEEPRLVEISAQGPLDTPQSLARASETLLLIPGQDVLGDGVVLELHGFRIQLLAPEPDGLRAGVPAEVRIRITMQCGCPIEPGGLWDGDKISIRARLVRDGAVEAEIPLTYAGETSLFEGTLTPPRAGAARLEVLASQPGTANFGRAVRDLSVTE
jgi:hypothetical protein